MKNRILKELANIEQAHGVKIICAFESGSRAWALHPGKVIMMFGLSMRTLTIGT
jgi:hypothetical protein